MIKHKCDKEIERQREGITAPTKGVYIQRESNTKNSHFPSPRTITMMGADKISSHKCHSTKHPNKSNKSNNNNTNNLSNEVKFSQSQFKCIS